MGIPLSTGTSPSDCLVSYPRHLLGGSYPPPCRGAVGIFYSPNRQGNRVDYSNILILKSICCINLFLAYLFHKMSLILTEGLYVKTINNHLKHSSTSHGLMNSKIG